MGVIVETSKLELKSNGPYMILPHHAIRRDSETTPVRVVINGDAKVRGEKCK